jgi:hypothetical protein
MTLRLTVWFNPQLPSAVFSAKIDGKSDCGGFKTDTYSITMAVPRLSIFNLLGYKTGAVVSCFALPLAPDNITLARCTISLYMDFTWA